MQKITETVKKQIDELLEKQDMVIVAIDGKCTSGKTTLASKLAEIYDCNVFTWMTFFSVRNSEHQSGLRRSAAMLTMSDSRKKCCFL